MNIWDRSLLRSLFGVRQPLLSPELPNNSILGNSPTAKDLRQQRGHIGHIRPKTIKGYKYYYWIYYDRGKQVEKYMGTDLKGASKKARVMGIHFLSAR
jgi:hypothetical protein